MESSPNLPNDRKESLAVLDAYVASHGLKSSPPKAFRLAPLAFRPDLMVLRPHRAPLALTLRSATVKPSDRYCYTTHTYLDPRKIEVAQRCADLPGAMFEPVIAYVMKTCRPTGPGLFAWQGCLYNVLGVRPADFLRRMKARAGLTWDKYDISAAHFEEFARPLSHWLSNSGLEVVA
ncbi:MAG TPA: hypothetical protein VG269_00110 [Tepidisphaeraceae bacterium]|jgi:hypothetical protein|nr:hypothetical protein [Tepidisphaeraceae bacterium]